MDTPNRIAIIVIFAVTFMIIGWMSPVLYATYAPDSAIIESHGFTAQDATTESDMHYVCFDRTVHRAAAGETFTELYLVTEADGDNVRREVSFETNDRYFQQGTSKVVTPLNLPDNVVAGEYRYLLVIQMELADGRVVRDFTFTSNKFNITNGVIEDTNNRSEVTC